MPEEVRIVVPGEPFAQPRANAAPLMRKGKPVLNRKTGRPVLIVYDTPGAKNWKATAQGHFMEARFPSGPLMGCLEGPLSLTVIAVFTCPKSDRLKRGARPRRWHTKRPDADNVLKAVKDAAKGVLWLDDCQVCRETCEKFIGAQGEAPYVEIRVSALGEILSEGGDAPRPYTETTDISNPAPSDTTPAGPQPELFNDGRS